MFYCSTPRFWVRRGAEVEEEVEEDVVVEFPLVLGKGQEEEVKGVQRW
jgi:hypothetical protein